MALYQKIKDYISSRIASGQWAPGARIPSEHELVRLLNASRMTVNRAIKELSEEGLVYRIAGVGSFVAEAHLSHPAASIVEISDEIAQRGQRHHARVVLLHPEVPGRPILTALSARLPREFFHSIIVHSADSVPLMLEDRWVNPRVAPAYLQADFTKTTPTRHLLKHAPLQRVEQTMAAITVDEPRADLLAIDAGEPILLVTRRTWTDDQVASLVHLYYVGAHYVLSQGAPTLPSAQPMAHATIEPPEVNRVP